MIPIVYYCVIMAWQCLHSFQLSNSTALAETRSEYSKVCRITQLEDLSACRLFADIRQVKENFPTRYGVTMLPQEFKWLIKRIQKNKRSGVKQIGQRVLTLTKPEKAALNIKLTRPQKEDIQVWLTGRELISLKEQSDAILHLLKEERKRVVEDSKSELFKNIPFDIDFNTDED